MTARLEPPDFFVREMARFEAAKNVAPRAALSGLGERMERVVKELAPNTGSGKFVAGLTHEVTGEGDHQKVRAWSTAEDAPEVESGRRPGRMPSYQVIAEALRLEPSQAFVVARSIGEKGTQGHHVFAKAAQHLGPETQKAGEEITHTVAKAL